MTADSKKGRRKQSVPPRTGVGADQPQLKKRPGKVLRAAESDPRTSALDERSVPQKTVSQMAESTGKGEEAALDAPALGSGSKDELGSSEITPDEAQNLSSEASVPEVLDDEAEDLTPVPMSLSTGKPRSSLPPARVDALDAYLREISRYPALTREEEHALAVKYAEHKDLEAARKLVYGNLWLVVKIAREYERAARNLLDLVQEGNMGLMEAVKNFDPFRGVRLPSYAVWWIKAYVIRYVVANWRLVKIGTTQAQRKLFFNLKKEKERLEREGFIATPKLIAEKLDVRESDVLEMEQRMSAPDASVDAPLGNDSDSSLLSVLPAEGEGADTILAAKQFQELLKENLEAFVAVLNEKQRKIFERRMIAEEKATLQEMSDDLGVSKERVRQIETQVKDKLKVFLTEHMGQELEEGLL